MARNRSLRFFHDGVHFSYRNFGKILAVGFILLQFAILLPNSWATVSMQTASHEGITYQQFFAEDLFQEIKDDIGLPLDSYNVVSIGLHPAIAQFNGFYTLDGYSNNYPLEYKHRFRQIISHELEKNPALLDYFDNMGSRCYMLIDELDGDFMCTKDKGLVINNLELNVTAMIEMNLSYIFSAVQITNHAANNMTLVDTYDNTNSAWRIYLYQLV